MLRISSVCHTLRGGWERVGEKGKKANYARQKRDRQTNRERGIHFQASEYRNGAWQDYLVWGRLCLTLFLSFFLSFTRNFDLPFYFNHLYFNRLTEACLNEP